MAESSIINSSSLIAISVGLLGPRFGEYGLILFAALGGSLWALSARPSDSTVNGVVFLCKIAITAILLTGALAGMLEHYTGFAAKQWLAPIAFIIGFFGENWFSIGQSLVSSVSKCISNRFEGK